MEQADEILKKLDVIIQKVSQEKENISMWRIAALQRISKAVEHIDDLIEIIETEMVTIESEKLITDRTSNVVPMKPAVAYVPQITEENSNFIQIVDMLKLIRMELHSNAGNND